MTTRKLSNGVRSFIVKSLACFETPTAVVKAVRREFGETISRRAVYHYHPYMPSGARQAPKWRQLFDETRKAVLEDIATIGMSHRAVRLRRLEAEFEENQRKGNSAMIIQLLKRAAEEMDRVEKSHALRGSSGGPVETRNVSDRERAKAILLILAKAKRERADA